MTHRHIHVGIKRHIHIHGTGMKRHIKFHDLHGRGIRKEYEHGEHSGYTPVVHSEGGMLMHSLKFHGGKRKNIHFQY